MLTAVSRDTRIDALKGLAIMCVVLYHTMGQCLITAPTLAPSPWRIPLIAALALALSMLATTLQGRWRVTATLLLGERWTCRSLPSGDVHTETI